MWPESVCDVFEWFGLNPQIAGVRVPRDVYRRWTAELDADMRFAPGMPSQPPWVLTFRYRHFILDERSPWLTGFRGVDREPPAFAHMEYRQMADE